MKEAIVKFLDWENENPGRPFHRDQLIHDLGIGKEGWTPIYNFIHRSREYARSLFSSMNGELIGNNDQKQAKIVELCIENQQYPYEFLRKIQTNDEEIRDIYIIPQQYLDNLNRLIEIMINHTTALKTLAFRGTEIQAQLYSGERPIGLLPHIIKIEDMILKSKTEDKDREKDKDR